MQDRSFDIDRVSDAGVAPERNVLLRRGRTVAGSAASLLVSLALCACAGSDHVPRVTPPPPHWIEPGGTFQGDSSVHFLPKAASKQKGAGSAEQKGQLGQDSRQTQEQETARFLDAEIQRKTLPRP